MVADLESIDLGTLLKEIRRESRKNRTDKRRLNYALANGLIEIIQAKGQNCLKCVPEMRITFVLKLAAFKYRSLRLLPMMDGGKESVMDLGHLGSGGLQVGSCTL